ncbi:dipeptidase [Bacillaceae bacterium]
MEIFDGHCDVLWKMWAERGRLSFEARELQANRERLRRGGVKIQVFAIFVPPEVPAGQRLQAALEMIDLFDEKIRKPYRQELVLIRKREDFTKLGEKRRWGAILSLEGAEALQGNIRNLRIFHRLGVRALGLTWNGRNEAADGVAEPAAGGLTRFGVSLVEEMNRLGMAVDVSHLAERSFWDVVERTTQPVIASHSNSRRICNHRRNLTNDQIRAIIRLNGVIGVTFVPEFTSSAQRVTVDDVLKHVDHICGLGGQYHLGFGSDFDGIERSIEGLENAAGYATLVNELVKRFPAEVVRALLYDNWRRLYERIL